MHRIKKDALFVIDGSYLLYRSFYAIKPLYTATGVPTQATFGFCRAIKKLIDDFDPGHMVIAWDGPVKSFRSEIFTEYKATRQKPPNELFVQKDYIFKFLDAIKLAQITKDGYEGDDVIAALATQYRDRQVVIVCADKDMGQLLSDNVLIFDPFKDRLIDKSDFKAEAGFDSEKIPFYYALLGDTSDNIPGVAGIGKKTAQELVQQFVSLDDLYANLEKIKKERTRTLLTEQKDNAYLSLQLFTLKPPRLDERIDDFVFDKNNWVSALPLFKDLQFGSLVKDVEKRFPAVQASMTQATIDAQQPAGGEFNTSIFGSQPAEPMVRTWELVVVQDEQALASLIALLQQKKYFGFDTETTGCEPLRHELVGMSFAVDDKTAYYIPFAHHTDQPQLPMKETLEKLRPIFEDESIEMVMQQAKFDQLVLWNNGIGISPITFDTVLAANLIRNDWQKINLKDLSMFFLNEPMKKFKDVLGKLKTFAEVPFDVAVEYGAHDALQTFKLRPVLEAKLNEVPALKEIFDIVEMPFYWVLLRMEQVGIVFESKKLVATAAAVNKDIAGIEDKIYAAISDKQGFGRESLNLNSPKQIERLLFDELGLPVVKKSSKGQRSTDQEVLQELSAVHAIPGLILQHRELSKLKNTYLDSLPEFVNPATGRIHTSYSQTMVATGRLSSTDPNLQNIPASEGYGMQIREAFVAAPGTVLMSADYSQIELRVLAFLSQDPILLDVFKKDRDIHTETASQLFGVPFEKVLPEQRQLGKRINFSIMYGVSPYGLSKDLDIKPNEAKEYIEKYFAQYPKVAAWMEKTVQQAAIDGYVSTWMGRRRYIAEIKEKNKMIFEAGRRIAINTPVQGTQAEIMKMAMINIDQALVTKKLAARMILQIHDEIILEVPESEIMTIESLVREKMETVVEWSVPLKVTLRTGSNWAEITK